MLMSLGTRAMNAAYAQLLTTSNNISNANTPGYSRQEAKLATSEGQFTGSGYFGRGVTVQTVLRASNMFLSAQAATARSNAGDDASQSDLLDQLQKVFGSGAAGLGAATTNLFNSFAELAAAPADLSARQAVLSRLEDFASLTRSNADSLSSLQAGVSQDLHNTVADVNTKLASLANLNPRIAEAYSTGQTPNDLLDQRDGLIGSLSDSMALSSIIGPDGSVSLFTVAGHNLVLGNTSNALLAQSDSTDPERVGISIKAGTNVLQLSPQDIGGGSISGLLNFQNGALVDARSRLGQMVSGLALALNQQQSRGIDLAGQPGSPLFKLDPPLALPAQSNLRSGGSLVSSTTLAITDPAALQASEYSLVADPANPGNYEVTRLSDGQVTSNLANGAVVDGFSFNIDVPLGARDRFLLKPVSASFNGIDVAIANPRGLAAASPVTAVAAAANTGTASIGSLRISAAPTLPYAPLSLQFTSGSGYGRGLDVGAAVLASGRLSSSGKSSGTVSFNGVDLALKGAPALGDKFSIAPTAFAASNNGNALSIDDMANAHLTNGVTTTDAYAQILSAVGLSAQSGQAKAATSAKVSAAANTALQGDIGVNLDEEAARLMQYQQSYQAAAKLLQTAQNLLDTLIQMGSR